MGRSRLVLVLVVCLGLANLGAAQRGGDSVEKLRRDLEALTARVAALESKVAVLEGTPTVTTTTTTAPPTTTTTTTTPPAAAVCDVAPASDPRAIEAAIAACPAGTAEAPVTVRFPTGASYRLSDRVVLLRPHDLVLDGNGSTFTATYPEGLSQRSQFTLFKPRNVVVRNLNLVGTFNPDPALYPRRQVMSHYCEAQAGVAVYGGRDVTLEDSTATRTCGDGFGAYRSNAFSDDFPLPGEALEFPTDVSFQRLRATTVARMCWGPTGGIRIRVVDNYCEDAWYGGIDIEVDAPDEPVQDIEIGRNRFRDFNIYGVLVPVGSPSGLARNIRIHDNVFETPPDNPCYPSVWIGSAQYAPTWRFADVHATGNTIQAIGAAVALYHVDGGSITANTVHRLPTRGGGTVLQDCGWGDEVFVVEDSTGVTAAENKVG